LATTTRSRSTSSMPRSRPGPRTMAIISSRRRPSGATCGQPSRRSSACGHARGPSVSTSMPGSPSLAHDSVQRTLAGHRDHYDRARSSGHGGHSDQAMYAAPSGAFAPRLGPYPQSHPPSAESGCAQGLTPPREDIEVHSPNSSGDLLPPSPPAEKAATSQYKAGQPGTGDGTGNGGGRVQRTLGYGASLVALYLISEDRVR
jgi:hypothetical protein